MSAPGADGQRAATRTRLVLVGGLPGSGKSTVAEGLQRATDVVLLSSDLVRQELDLPRDDRYAPAAVQRVYDLLLDRAGEALSRGRDVVLDASWTSVEQRRAAAALARRTGSTLVTLWCEVGDEVAETRLRARPADHPSDARSAVRALLGARGPRPDAIVIDTGGPAHAAVARAVEAHRLAGGALPHDGP